MFDTMTMTKVVGAGCGALAGLGAAPGQEVGTGGGEFPEEVGIPEAHRHVGDPGGGQGRGEDGQTAHAGLPELRSPPA